MLFHFVSKLEDSTLLDFRIQIANCEILKTSSKYLPDFSLCHLQVATFFLQMFTFDFMYIIRVLQNLTRHSRLRSRP